MKIDIQKSETTYLLELSPAELAVIIILTGKTCNESRSYVGQTAARMYSNISSKIKFPNTSNNLPRISYDTFDDDSVKPLIEYLK